jgi:protein-L-isoaspartate(D-aspartate) O-methyltransferase
MDFERARFNMIEQQIRPWEVLDPMVLDALGVIRREDYVPERYRTLAFVDMEIPLGEGEVMMSPKVEARLVQALGLARTDHVLEIGTGSGYLTALLAYLSGHVTSVERIERFSSEAARRLAAGGIGNVTLEIGDGANGWPAHGPYDAIVLTGSLPVLPDTFAATLAPEGRLVAIVGDAPAMTARLVTRVGDAAFQADNLFETVIAPLRNARQPARFVF